MGHRIVNEKKKKNRWLSIFQNITQETNSFAMMIRRSSGRKPLVKKEGFTQPRIHVIAAWTQWNRCIQYTITYVTLITPPTRRRIVTFISNEARRWWRGTLFLHPCIVFIYRATANYIWKLTSHLFAHYAPWFVKYYLIEKAFLRFILVLLIDTVPNHLPTLTPIFRYVNEKVTLPR